MTKNLLLILVILVSGLFSNACAQNVFQIYNTVNSGLPNNTCWFVKAAGNNEIFATTWGGGAAMLNANGMTQSIYNMFNSPLTTNQTTAIAKGPNDLLYIATEAGGIMKRASGIWSLMTTTNSGLSGNTTYAMEYDKLDNLWIGTRYNAVSVLNSNGTWTYHNSSNSTLSGSLPVYGIAVDAFDNKWIGTGYGGLHVKTSTMWTNFTTSNSNIPHNDVYAVAAGANGVMWVGTFAGLGKFNGSSWTNYTIFNSGLPYNYIRHLKVDGNNNVWIATGGGGIAKFDGANWTVYNTSNSNIPSNNVFALDIDSEGFLWAATYGGGIIKMTEPLSVKENSSISQINVYPNPATDFITLDMKDIPFGKFNLTVFDASGKLVLNRNFVSNGASNQNEKLEIADLNSGMYFINLQGERSNHKGKFTISK